MSFIIYIFFSNIKIKIFRKILLAVKSAIEYIRKKYIFFQIFFKYILSKLMINSLKALSFQEHKIQYLRC